MAAGVCIPPSSCLIPLPAFAATAAAAVCAAQLSPDNQFLAYVKPSPETGVANVFIRKLQSAPRPRTAFESARSPDSARVAREVSIFERDGTVGDRQITFDKNEGVSAYSWSEDGSSILYIQVNLGGGEGVKLGLGAWVGPADNCLRDPSLH